MITGASGGIGRAIALAFAQQGDNVVMGSHTNYRYAQKICSTLQKDGHICLAVQADVSDAHEVEGMFAAAEEAFGPVEILINSAGISQQKLFCDITEDEWDTMFSVHVKGTFLSCRRALPHMLRIKQGCIINIASVWGQVGASCESHYAAAKAAVISLTKSLAKEEGPSGVRVNCIAPGAIDTAMMDGFSADEKRAFCEDIPLGRLGTPEEVAAVAVFLASDAASYITGQIIAPNGGFVV